MTYWNESIIRIHTEMHTYLKKRTRDKLEIFPKYLSISNVDLLIGLVLGIFSACAEFYKNVQIPKS